MDSFDAFIVERGSPIAFKRIGSILLSILKKVPGHKNYSAWYRNKNREANFTSCSTGNLFIKTYGMKTEKPFMHLSDLHLEDYQAMYPGLTVDLYQTDSREHRSSREA